MLLPSDCVRGSLAAAAAAASSLRAAWSSSDWSPLAQAGRAWAQFRPYNWTLAGGGGNYKPSSRGGRWLAVPMTGRNWPVASCGSAGERSCSPQLVPDRAARRRCAPALRWPPESGAHAFR